MRGGTRWATLALLCVAQVMDVLGVTVVIVALPSISGELGLSPGQAQWVVTVYALLFGGSLLVAGRAADLFGRRLLFLLGLALFVAASLVAGLAGSLAVLVGARTAQGIGAALVVPAALSLLTSTFPEGPERARALAIWTAAAAGGGALGWFAGGVLTGGPGWRWVFLVNVPIGAAALALAPFLLRESRDPAASPHLDLVGALTVTGGLILLILGMTRTEDGVDPEDLATIAGALALLAAFPAVERRVPDPLAPPGALRSRGLTGAALVAFTVTATTSAAGVLATRWVQEVLGWDPLTTGLAFLPFSAAVIPGSLLAPVVARRLGDPWTMAAGLLVIGAGLGAGSLIGPDGGFSILLPGLIVAGVGLGWASVTSTGVGTSALPPGEQGLASGMLNTAAQVGTAIGIAALATVAALVTTAAAGDPATTDPAALTAGFRTGFAVIAALAAAGAAASLALLGVRPGAPRSGGRWGAGGPARRRSTG